MKKLVMALAVAGTMASFAQGTAKSNFMQQQAYAEMQRVVGQVEALEQNHAELERKVAADASARAAQKAEIDALKGEVAALKGVIIELRKSMDSQRQEIVGDLTKRISKMTTATAPSAKQSAPKAPESIGPHFEYTVESGDTLSLIAKAFKTTTQKIKDANGLKNDNLRIGQKLRVPKE